MPTDATQLPRPRTATGVAIAVLWAVLAVWSATSGQTGPGVGAGLLAALWLFTVIRRHRAHSTYRRGRR